MNDGLRTALHAQFGTEVIDVSLHRVHAPHETAANLAIGRAFGEQVQHLAFALGQGFS